MRLLDARTPREICVALTYNLDLAWFEALVQPALRARGVRQIVIFADAARVAETLEIQGPILRSAGAAYQVVPVRAKGAFHPKAMLISGEEGATLQVGTGNLTSSGWGRNLEAYERWTAESGDVSISPVFGEFQSFLHEVVERMVTPTRRVLNVLDEAFSFAPFGLPEHKEPIALIGVTPPDRLIDRIPEAPTPAFDLKALAPYFDDDGDGVCQLAARLRAEAPTVLTDARTSTLRSAALRNIESAGGRVLLLDEEENDRQLHAKVLCARGEDWSIGVVGSPNLSRAAWLGSNVELAVLRRDASAARVTELLDHLTTRELSNEDREWLVAQPESDPPEPSGPALRGARFEDDLTIRFVQEEPIERVEVRIGGKEAVVSQLREQEVVLRARGRGRGVTLLRALASEVAGPWTLVDDPAALAERAERSRPTALELERLALAAEYDPHSIERFMALITAVAHGRGSAPNGGPHAPLRTEEAKAQPRLRRFTDADFDSQEDSAAGLEARRKLRLAPTRLLEALLFGGDERSDASSDEGESGDADTSDDIELPPSRDRRPQGGTPERRRKFSERVAKMRQAYLARSEFLAADRGARRLFEDLLVLVAPLHLLFAHADLDRRSFNRELVIVLRAFLGSATGPIVSRLRVLDDEERHTLWATTPIGLQFCLLVYNTLLTAVGDRDPSEFAGISERSILWLGRLLAAAPETELQRLAGRADKRLPQLRRGALWIADAWPAHQRSCPFPEFVDRAVESTRRLGALSHALRAATEQGHCTPGIALAPFRDGRRDETCVLEFGPAGELIPGFAEWDDRLEVWIHTDLFSTPEPRGTQVRMRRADVGRVYDLLEVERALGAAHAEAICLVRHLA